MNSFVNDLRHAARALLARPGFTLTAVLTLMLGIGAITAIFTVYDAVLLRPLPFDQPERIVQVVREEPPIMTGPVSAPVFREWSERSREAFEAIGAFMPQTMSLTGSGNAERFTGYAVTPGFWDVLHQPIALGRGFGASEDTAGERVVVLSDALWRARFNADPAVLGRDLVLNGQSWRVVGVAAPGAGYPAEAQLWIPAFQSIGEEERGNNMFLVLARLASGVSVAQARAVMEGVVTWQKQAYPDANQRFGVNVIPLQEMETSSVRDGLSLLLAAALLVLLVACANLASLMLTRGQTRAQELAVRSALGAGHGRLLRAMLAESALLAIGGAIAALALAHVAVPTLLALAPDLLPAYNLPAVNLRVVAGTAGFALLALVLAGLAPAWRAARVDPGRALAATPRGATGGAAQARARGALVSAEVALACTLLVGAGVILQGLRQLATVDLGLRDPAQVLTARISVPVDTGTPGGDFVAWYLRTKAALAPTSAAIEQAVAELPGVEAVAITMATPGSGEGGWNGSFELPGADVPEDALADYFWASPGTLATYGIPLVAGRMFDAADGQDEGFPNQVLVSQAFVERYLGGADAVGREIRVFGPDPKTIIGVVGSVRQFGPMRAPSAAVWFPATSLPSSDMTLGLRVQGDAMAMVPALRKLMRERFPDVPVYAVRTLDEASGETLRMRRFLMTLLGAFALTALLLAAIGLYGVLGWMVALRRREIGVRRSFGATRARIHRLMLASALRMLLPGILAGLLGAWALGRVIASQLRGTEGFPLPVVALVLAVLAAAALPACLLPSWRALRGEPVEALREE